MDSTQNGPNPDFRLKPEWTQPQMDLPQMDLTWTQLQMDSTPKGLNPEGT